MKKLTRSEFLARYDESVHARIIANAGKPGVDAVVSFECLDFNSSRLGDRTACIVGPGCTFKSVAAAEGKWLNDLPSQRQYAHEYVDAADLVGVRSLNDRIAQSHEQQLRGVDYQDAAFNACNGRPGDFDADDICALESNPDPGCPCRTCWAFDWAAADEAIGGAD
ncbi:MAG: hypothetical protein WCS70_06850 [Verrucomicrobiota bacterium]